MIAIPKILFCFSFYALFIFVLIQRGAHKNEPQCSTPDGGPSKKSRKSERFSANGQRTPAGFSALRTFKMGFYRLSKNLNKLSGHSFLHYQDIVQENLSMELFNLRFVGMPAGPPFPACLCCSPVLPSSEKFLWSEIIVSHLCEPAFLLHPFSAV